MQDEPRYLARTGRAIPLRRDGQPRGMSDDEAEGYTNKPIAAMHNEPEPVTREEQRRMSAQSRLTTSERVEQEEEQRERLVEQQLRSATEELRAVAKARIHRGQTNTSLFAEVDRVLRKWK